MAAAAQPTYMTGFMIFCAEVRDEIVREIGESDPTEGGRRMFKMWKALPEAKRQVRLPAPRAAACTARDGPRRSTMSVLAGNRSRSSQRKGCGWPGARPALALSWRARIPQPQRSSSSGDGAKKPRKRQRKDPSAPKRALTAYMCFKCAVGGRNAP